MVGQAEGLPPVSAGYRARAPLQRADVMLRREERASLNIHSTKTSNFPSICNFPCMHVSSVFQVGPSTSTFVTPVHYVRGFFIRAYTYFCLSLVINCLRVFYKCSAARGMPLSRPKWPSQLVWRGSIFGVWPNYARDE